LVDAEDVHHELGVAMGVGRGVGGDAVGGAAQLGDEDL